MNWAYLWIASTVVLWVLICINAWRLWRGRGDHRKTIERLQWLADEVERIALLDCLLMQLCGKAAADDTASVWRAWAQTMGSLRVSVAGSFRGRTWETDALLPTGAEDVPGFLREDFDDQG